MRQLPELVQNFPESYRNINLKEMGNWIRHMISIIPPFGEINNISKEEPPKLIHG